MTVHLSLAHEFPISEAGFWEKIFKNADFNRALYEDHLGFEYKLEEWNKQSGVRRARIWPTADVPKPVAAVLGDRISFLEDGVFDRENARYDFLVIPSTMPDRIKTKGSVQTQSLGDARCVRKVEIAIEARIFGIGKAVESFLKATTKEQYESNARFVLDYLAKN